MSDSSLSSKAGLVLVVEGDDAARRVIEGALRPSGYEVAAAATAAEGLELAARSPPQAIVFSDKPPALDGALFLRGLAEAGLPAPVVMTGGATSMARIIDVLRAGALEYLRKPLVPKAIGDAVARAITVAEARRTKRDEARLRPPGLQIPPPQPPPAARASRPRLHPALADLADGLAKRGIEVPAVPTVVAELRKAIGGQRSSLDDVARLVQRDQSLALDVLKIANSATYARGTRTSDLKAAVGRIGLAQLEGLIEMVFLRGCYQPRQPLFKALLAELWRYSIAMAIAMRVLAEGMSGPSRLDPGVAYVAGLFSDVGAAFLLWLVSERAPELEMEIFLPFVRERHELLGGQLLGTMGLDPAIVQLASYHHSQSAPTGVSLYWSLAAVASELADRAVPAGDLTRRARRGVAFVGQCADSLRITETALRKAGDQLEEELQAIVDALF